LNEQRRHQVQLIVPRKEGESLMPRMCRKYLNMSGWNEFSKERASAEMYEVLQFCVMLSIACGRKECACRHGPIIYLSLSVTSYVSVVYKAIIVTASSRKQHTQAIVMRSACFCLQGSISRNHCIITKGHTESEYQKASLRLRSSRWAAMSSKKLGSSSADPETVTKDMWP
jgi:hypothetical protein